MTIQSATARVSFICNGTSTVFPVPIQAYLATDFLVLATNVTTGASIVLVLNGDYVMLPSGTLSPTQWTLTTQSGQLPSPYAPGYVLQVILNPVETQTTQYTQGQAFPSLAVETNIDRLTQMDIRQTDQLSRAIVAPDSDTTQPIMVLPPAASRANTGLIFDSNGNVSVGVIPTVVFTQALFNAYLAASGAFPVTSTQISIATTNAEVAAGAIIINAWYQPGTVDRYGTNTVPGTTDMTVAIKTAWNVAKAQGGGTIRFINGVQYALSSLDPASPISLASQNSNGTVGIQFYQTQLYCLGGTNIVWDFAGAQIKSTITGGGVGILFDNCQGITLNQPNMVGTQVHISGVVALGGLIGGSGYGNGTYVGVLMSGGTGHGCCCTVVVAGGIVTSCVPTYPGGGFVVGDVLSTANTNLGGSGSGFSVQVSNITGAGNVVAVASVLPFCVTSLSGTSSNITTTDLTSKDCFTGFSVIDGTNGNVTAGISLLGHTTVVNAEYGVTLQNGGDDAFIENLVTFRTTRPYFLYGVQNVVLANLDAQQTNYGFGSIIKAYSRSTRNITVNAVYRNAPGNNTSRLSIQVQCDPAVVNPPPTVKNLWITHDENGQPLQTGTAIEFDYFAGSGGTVQTATSSNQLFDQIAIKGITQGYLFSTVQLTTAAAQCQINYDNLEANWSGIVGSGQDIRAGLGFIASREFFCTMSLTFGGTTVAGTNIAPQCFISDGFCKVQGTCTLTAKNGTGQAAFVLPFASRLDATGFSLSPVLGISSMVGLTGTIVGAMGGNSNIMNLYMQAATTLTSVADTNFSASSVLYFDVTYPI